MTDPAVFPKGWRFVTLVSPWNRHELVYRGCLTPIRLKFSSSSPAFFFFFLFSPFFSFSSPFGFFFAFSSERTLEDKSQRGTRFAASPFPNDSGKCRFFREIRVIRESRFEARPPTRFSSVLRSHHGALPLAESYRSITS